MSAFEVWEACSRATSSAADGLGKHLNLDRLGAAKKHLADDMPRSRLFRRYKEVHSFSPVIPDIEGFEAELCKIIEARDLVAPGIRVVADERQRSQATSVSWLSLLFAILSYGEQSSESGLVHRREKSRLYGMLHQNDRSTWTLR